MIEEEKLTTLNTLMQRQMEIPFIFAKTMQIEQFDHISEVIGTGIDNLFMEQFRKAETILEKARVNETILMTMMEMITINAIGGFVITLGMLGIPTQALATDDNVKERYTEFIEMVQSEFISTSLKVSEEFLKDTGKYLKVEEMSQA